MQSNKTAFNTSIIKTFKHIFCKMKARSWTGSRTSLIRVNILIALTVSIIIFTTNIWRKRNVSITFEPFFINSKIKFHGTKFSSCISRNINNCTNCSIWKFIMHTRLLFFCIFYHCIPNSTFLIYSIQKHKFLFTSSSFFNTINTSTTNPAIIKNHKCICRNQIW